MVSWGMGKLGDGEVVSGGEVNGGGGERECW